MGNRLSILIICLSFLAGLLYSKYGFHHSAQNKAGNFVAELKEKTHQVQARRAQSLSWDDVNEGEHFQYYDSILTMKASSASIAFKDGTNLEIGADSLAVLEPPLQKQSGMRLNLKQGTATLHIKKGEKVEAKNNLIMALEDITLKLSSNPKLGEDSILLVDEKRNQSNPKKSPVEMISKIPTQRARNPAGANAKPLPGPIIKVKYQIFRIETSHYNTKSLLQRLSLLFISVAEADTVEGGEPQIEWENLSGAQSYEVEISKDKEFKNVVMTKTTKDNVTNVEITNPGTFYWHVRGIDQLGNAGEFSKAASFEVLTSTKKIVAQSSPPVEDSNPKPKNEPSPPDKPQESPPKENVKATPPVDDWVEEPKGHVALDLRGLGTWGSMSDSAGAIPTRSMLTGSIASALGFRLGNFTPSLYGEYFISGQTTSPSSVQNQNASGQGYLLGGELKWKRRKFSIAGSYLFLGQYQLNQQTILSQKSIYDQPSGFGLTLGWTVTHRLSFLVVGKYISYNDWNLDGNISGDPVTQINCGIGLSYEFF